MSAADPYRCPIPCDEDCEINGWGCHESHVPTWKREHEPMACEARTLASNLTWLFDSGWFTQLESRKAPGGGPAVFFAGLGKPGGEARAFTGASVAEAAGKAAKWAREGAGT